MPRIVELAGISLVSVMVCYASPSFAKGAEGAQSKACRAKAIQQGRVGDQRNAFIATCLKGALSPKMSTGSGAKSGAARAVTAPSGADRTDRSTQCNAEAVKRGLHDTAFQSFRKGCLASAAPVGAIESSQTPTKPTASKPKLESLTNTPPK